MNRRYLPLIITALVLALLIGLGGHYFKNFLSLRVMINLLGDNAFLGVTAVGITVVLISGGIDLSVASVIAFTTIFVAETIETGLLSPFAAIASALLLGTLFGAAQGWFIAFFNLHPYLVTLSGMFFARGVGFMINAESIAIKHPFYTETLRTLAIPLRQVGRMVVRLPFTAQCLILFIVGGTILLGFTRFGRYVYAIGSNEASARLMGVPVDRIKIMVYALSGFCAASGGVVATFFMPSGNSSSFVGLEMDAIAAAVIGGTLLTGGVGWVVGTLMGVLILGVIQSLITFQGTLNNWWAKIFIGVLLFCFISIQQFLNRRLMKKAH